MLIETLLLNSAGREWEIFSEITANTLHSPTTISRKPPVRPDGYDSVSPDGLKVRIKANHSSSTIGFRDEADLLLVLKVESTAEERTLLWTLQTSQGEGNIFEA
jgi:hypothetical protein